MAQSFIKDPDAVLDYKWDWSSWLESAETISSTTVTADSGLTVDSSSITDSSTSVTAWLSGGTTNRTYDVVCHIVTSVDREDDRTIIIRCKEQ